MFNLDRWYEILDTIRRNKLRTALTGLSVAWGILMLIILLGAGTGLQNSVEYRFRDDAVNSLWIRPGRTSLPYEGHAVGREVRLTDADFARIARMHGVEHLTGRFNMWNNLIVSYGDKKSSFDVRATHPDHKYLELTIIKRGRFITDLDLTERRKVAVIGIKVAEFLFGDADPLGEWIEINAIAYRVVGIFEDVGGEGELLKIYVPITTAQMAYGGGDRMHQIMFTVGDMAIPETKRLEAEVLAMLAGQHHFDTTDQRAVRIRNNLESFKQITDIFFIINAIVVVVGGFTIVAGIVGVSNIMLISVKERTREIGIRKALGATPRSIVSQIVQEAVFITGLAGYLGLVAGIGLLELVGRFMPENDFIREPRVDFQVAFIATLFLVLAGALAGYFPARRAAKVDPVVALRDE